MLKKGSVRIQHEETEPLQLERNLEDGRPHTPATSFRERMLDLVNEYEALESDHDNLLKASKVQSDHDKMLNATTLQLPHAPGEICQVQVAPPPPADPPCMLMEVAMPFQVQSSFDSPGNDHPNSEKGASADAGSAPPSPSVSMKMVEKVATAPTAPRSSALKGSGNNRCKPVKQDSLDNFATGHQSMPLFKFNRFMCDTNKDAMGSSDLFSFRRDSNDSRRSGTHSMKLQAPTPMTRQMSIFEKGMNMTRLLSSQSSSTNRGGSSRTNSSHKGSMKGHPLKSRSFGNLGKVISRAQSWDFRGIADDDRRPLRRARVGCADWFLGTQRGQWLLLSLTGSCLVWVGAVAWSTFGGNEEFDRSWIDSVWMSYCLFIDPGTQTGIPASDPDRVKITASVLSLVGFCFNLSFLGMIVELVKGTLQRWKKERYRIVLTGHVLVLGWTDKTLFLLTELLKRAAADRRQVVILAMRDEYEMMQDIRNHLWRSPHLIWHVKVCKGCPFDVDDLVRVSAGSAADVVVLCRKGSNANLEMVRVMVALAALPEEVTGKVIAEVWDADAEPVLEVLLANTDGISARPAIRRLFCMMVIQPLIAQCLIALCSAEEPEELRVIPAAYLAGKTFGQACRSFSTELCIGVKSRHTKTKVLPPEDYVINKDDQFLVIARSKQKKDHMRNPMMFQVSDDRDVMIAVGWCEDFVEMISVLDRMVDKTVSLHILSEKLEEERYHDLSGVHFRNLILHHHVGSCRAVQNLASLPLTEAAVIMVLAEASQQVQRFDTTLTGDDLAGDDAITTDSASLTVMVTITGIVEGLYGHERQRGIRARIICEVFDPRTDQLLARNSALQEHAVFFRSNALETAMFRTAAENPIAFNALNQMLCAQLGQSMVLVPVTTYLPPRHSHPEHMEPGETLNDEEGISFWDMHSRVRSSVDAKADGSLLIGWLRIPSIVGDSSDNTRHSSIVIAPPINRHKPLIWRFGDHLLVLRNNQVQQNRVSANRSPTHPEVSASKARTSLPVNARTSLPVNEEEEPVMVTATSLVLPNSPSISGRVVPFASATLRATPSITQEFSPLYSSETVLK